ncbi:hypothetical protein [Sporosarcina pasteurii]|uniref:Uncharacterized protein n=1 Tax=Sporosarcina pasteurii TaxID=1474 RepID=A0A380BW46_SPOPA|nr:hypothetical protein [Sporosarcina pasteurii]MDS9471374.1 hypothetical protein [Sporosarcina pasteurii]QBQ04998.1 hypothetical protein E2C16_04630 [Sporosarcina pasteurii]SUJ08182.1 Uncharacterised protein [Sporosarcina pasteurii]
MFMKKGCLTIIALLVVVLALFPILSNVDDFKSMVTRHTSVFLSEERQLKVFEESLIEDGGFFDQVSKKISEQGYEHIMQGMVYSKEDIRIEVLLTNTEASDEVRKEIVAMFNETVIKNKMEPSIFEVKVRAE